MAELTRQEVLAQSLKDYRNSPIPPMTDGGMCLNSEGKKVGCNTLNQTVVNAPVNVPQTVQVKQTFLQKNQTMLIAVGVPVGFYAFSKYQKYDSKKTAKVTIIGSVVVFGALVINALSGFGSGNTYAKRLFGKQITPKQIPLIQKPV
jgi:hypothetical protein